MATSAARLLILDDDETVSQTLAAAAEACGFETRWCGDAAGLDSCLAGWSPTHIALDLSLGGPDGAGLLPRLAAQAGAASLIVFSGAAPADVQRVVERAQAIGLTVRGVLAKPFRLAALRVLLAPPG